MDRKVLYLKSILFSNDISVYLENIINEKDLLKQLMFVKNYVVVLDIFRSSLNEFSYFQKDTKNQEIINLNKELKKDFLFINHLRNKICGQLDRIVIE